MVLKEYSPLILVEHKLQRTMRYAGKNGNCGFEILPGSYIHYIFANTSNPEYEVNGETMQGGTIPTSVVYGKKIPQVTLTGYFPYQYPDEFYSDFMPSLAPHRRVNSVKNIFLTGTILSVPGHDNPIYQDPKYAGRQNIFLELPEKSNWYIKQYKWRRDLEHPTRGMFNLVLLRWYKEVLE